MPVRWPRALALRDPTTLPWVAPSQVPRQALDVLDIITRLRIDYLPAAGASPLRLLLTLLGLTELFEVLILGAPTRTTDANRALAALGSRVRADDTLRALFSELDGDRLAERLDQAPEFADFRVAVDAFSTSTATARRPACSWSPRRPGAKLPRRFSAPSMRSWKSNHRPHPGATASSQPSDSCSIIRFYAAPGRTPRVTHMGGAARAGIALREALRGRSRHAGRPARGAGDGPPADRRRDPPRRAGGVPRATRAAAGSPGRCG